MAKVTIRMDDKLKKDVEELFDEFGMNMTTAFTIFAKTVVREKRIPFEIGISKPNEITKQAMEEAERILADPSKTIGYSDVHQMFKEILDEE